MLIPDGESAATERKLFVGWRLRGKKIEVRHHEGEEKEGDTKRE